MGKTFKCGLSDSEFYKNKSFSRNTLSTKFMGKRGHKYRQIRRRVCRLDLSFISSLTLKAVNKNDFL